MPDKIPVYLEIGKKKTFACAVEWPGWARSGRDEAEALAALLAYAPRYAHALAGSGLAFEPPAGVEALEVVERLEGNQTTDFGAPAAVPAADERPVDEAELRRLTALLEACWQAFEAAEQGAAGKPLRKGPRGGGRELERMVQHVLGAEAGYQSALGRPVKHAETDTSEEERRRLRQAGFAALAASARGEIPRTGPRGGERWPARYYARRAAWHLLDHAWEIEDRVEDAGAG